MAHSPDISTTPSDEQGVALLRGKVDLVTFEVLRHRLWAINDEAAAVLRRVSGSPVAFDVNDFNTTLLDAQGNAFIVGVYMLSIAIGQDMVAKYILEHYQENPGINPDDMFICNDPYIGSPHQNEVTVVAPIHWQGELVAWATASIHQQDVGGPTKGSQVSVGAKSIFEEAFPMAPMKIIEGGVMRKDIEEEYLRRSRTRELNALDLRAKIASNQVRKRRIHQIIEQYGVDTVKSVIQGMIDYAETRFRARLRELPDGTWRHTTFLDHCLADGSIIYPIKLAMTKRGDQLHFDFTGTAKQAPAIINCAYQGLIAGIIGAVFPYLCYDLPWSPAGVLKAINVTVEPATVVNASWPAGVCKATTAAITMVNTVASICVAKMLAASDAYRDHTMASWMSVAPVQELFGTNQRGETFGATLLDQLAGGGGARSDKDGIDTGSIIRSLHLTISNVETYEFLYPLLYLARRQQPDSGGAGTFRGGVGVSILYTPYDIDEIPTNIMHTICCEQPASVGIFGGYPGATNQFTIKRNSNIWRLFEKNLLPTSLDEVEGELEIEPGIKESNLRLGDVYRCVTSGGGGYGDPLRRDPARVLRDVQQSLVTPEAGRSLYGVVVDASAGQVDAAQTTALRAAMRRLQGGAAGSPPPAPAAKRAAAAASIGEATWRQVGANLFLEAAGSEAAWQRCRCGQALGAVGENFKAHTVVNELPLQAAGPHVDPYNLGKGKFVFRQFLCPSCAVLLETEVALKGTPFEWDIEVR
ncbi:MAG: hydantoinase B/oxoprolinase family protein [Candidatus Tectomicrobia bacterium]|nr:hydantoinase B/oxoprolinase family protein [Candidatus Tectomicrobia bacterium]